MEFPILIIILEFGPNSLGFFLQILSKTQVKYTKLGSLLEKLKLRQNENFVKHMISVNPGENEANSHI